MAEALTVGLLGMLLASLSSCRNELPTAAVVEQIEGYFAPLGIEPDSVRCEQGPSLEVGASVACTVEVDGESIDMQVEVVSNEGALTIRPRHDTLVTAEVESEIAQSLREQARAVEHVRCEGRLWVARPGARHRCAIQLESGERLSWVGTFSGDGSKHRARIEPLTPPRGTP